MWVDSGLEPIAMAPRSHAYTVEETYFLAPRKSTRAYSPPDTSRSLPDKRRRYSGTAVFVDGNSYRTLSEYGDVLPPSLRSPTPTLPPIKSKEAFMNDDDQENIQKNGHSRENGQTTSDYYDSEPDDRDNGYDGDEEEDDISARDKDSSKEASTWRSEVTGSSSEVTGSEADSGLGRGTASGSSFFIPGMRTVPEHEPLGEI
ncbi:hypothetical protein PoB_002994800 [Plakobranchus ocellatus]|uniref:Uncharacterized protein n=1 Tax=Plakobranchus ocellatus TaxID=259542 RepID=A0AAV4A882_9GAST|nr:hypothetical protein PoB_002994800 [Plakobranchus ocellatus]